MNKVETLAALFGSKASLALTIDRHPSLVSRMIKRGKVDPSFNPTLRAYISGWEDPEKVRQALECLEPDTCPTCGQPVPHGVVL